MKNILQKINRFFHIHRYTWTPETKTWFFTGVEAGHIGSECRCGKLSDKL